MFLSNLLAQRAAWKRGVVHTTLNPEGPGCVRIHLVPPKFRVAGDAPWVVILNGYYLLPIGYAWAVLLEHFILEVNRYDGEPMDEGAMEQAVEAAVSATKKVYPEASQKQLRADMGELLQVLFDIAREEKTDHAITPLSLREYAPHMTGPHRMDLMVSAMTDGAGDWHCNLKCRHCYAAGQSAAGAAELSTEDWKRIIDRCREAMIPQLTFTGGEPTMRGDLVELVEYARWFVTRLNTNGIKLTPALCAALRTASLDAVQVTLYAGEAAVHDPLVGVEGGWAGSVAGLRNALAAGLDVSVNTPLCRDNEDYLSTLDFLRGEGVRYVTCSGLIETGKAKGTSGSSQLSRSELDGILRRAAAYCAGHGMELQFTSPGRCSPEVLRELGLTVPVCGACLSNMAVAPDGQVMPCQSWLGADAALGSMLDQPWSELWDHPACRSIRSMGEDEALQCPLRVQKEGGGGA